MALNFQICGVASPRPTDELAARRISSPADRQPKLPSKRRPPSTRLGLFFHFRPRRSNPRPSWVRSVISPIPRIGFVFLPAPTLPHWLGSVMGLLSVHHPTRLGLFFHFRSLLRQPRPPWVRSAISPIPRIGFVFLHAATLPHWLRSVIGPPSVHPPAPLGLFFHFRPPLLQPRPPWVRSAIRSLSQPVLRQGFLNGIFNASTILKSKIGDFIA
jgi:hypothetical protein